MERKINLLKANSILLDMKLRREIKGRAFDALRVASARLDPEGIENLVEEEVELARSTSCPNIRVRASRQSGDQRTLRP